MLYFFRLAQLLLHCTYSTIFLRKLFPSETHVFWNEAVLAGTWLIFVCLCILYVMECSWYFILCLQIQNATQLYEQLQELNLELEIEHCTSLQDIDITDNQLYKYQQLLKTEEVAIILLIILLLCCRAVDSFFQD